MRSVLLFLLWSTSALAVEPRETSGADIYAARCATCHGAEGRGDGPAAGALPRKPRDFTDAAFWADTTLAAIRTSIRKGRPGTAMRAYPMDDTKLEALIAYLQTFKPTPAQD